MAKRVTPEDVDFVDPEMRNLDGVPYVDDDMPYVDDDMPTVSLSTVELPEAAPTEAEEVAPAEAEAEEASAESDEEASVRRSRRAGKKPTATINLDEIEEFRRWKAEADRKLAEERKRREELERQIQERQAALASSRQQEIAQRIAADDGLMDVAEKQRLLEEYAQLVWQQNQARLESWRRAKRELLESYGLNPDDERFSDQHYASDPESAWYRLKSDAAEAAVEKARREAEEAKAKLADIPNLIRHEVARFVATKGLATADLGEEGGARQFDTQEWERDARLVQLGRMSPEAYLRKWGRR